MTGDQSQELPEESAHLLQRCDGYLDLKMARRARAEWERVPVEHQQHPVAQALLLRLLAAEHQWVTARELATAWCEREPDNAGAWIQLAYVTRRAEGLTAAEKILTIAHARFPKESVIPYNLACYACQSGRLDEARSLLQEAVLLDPGTLSFAAEDDDLRPLWPELPS